MTTASQKQEQAIRVAEILKVLAHPSRLMAVCYLLGGERCAREITAHLQTTKSNASQHLSALIQTGVLAREVRGNQCFYRIADEKIRSMISFLEQNYCPEGGLINQEVSNDESERTPGCKVS